MHSVDYEQQPNEQEADPLEDSELALRLRAMKWPTAPPGVKERCLKRVLARIELEETDADPRASSG